MRALVLSVLLLLPLPAAAEQVVLGLSRDEVAITATFEGSDILIFGAVKRDTPVIDPGSLDVIITVAGPSLPVTVRRKGRVMGIWANVASAEITAAPSFYAVATTGPLDEVLAASEDLTHSITIPRAIRAMGGGIEGTRAFTQALIRIRAGDGLYQVLEDTVRIDEDTLFNTRITLPANLTEGDYRTRIFLTREGRVVDIYETTIAVKKVGLERWLYNLAHERSLLYGLMSLAIAIAAGWGASAAFRALQR